MKSPLAVVSFSIFAVGLLGACNGCGSDSNKRSATPIELPSAPKVDDSPSPTPPRPPSSTERAWILTTGFDYERIDRRDGILGVRQSARRAVVTLDQVAEECSGMGGTHLVFQLDDSV